MKGLIWTLLVFSIYFFRANSNSARGPCPEIQLQQNFTLEKYMGTWYEIERFPSPFVKGKCIAERYIPESDAWVKIVTHELLANGSLIAYEGDLTPANVNETAKLQFRTFRGLFPRMIREEFPGISFIPYRVVSTNYTNYSLVYSCSMNFAFRHTEYAWILARERHLEENIINQLHDILKSYNVDVNKMVATDQEDCPTYR